MSQKESSSVGIVEHPWLFKGSLFLCLCSLLLFFGFKTVDFFSNRKAPEVPKLTGRVVDTANIFSPAAERDLTQEIKELEAKTGGQFAILTIQSLGTDSIEKFSIRVAEAWKIGMKGADNGAIFTMALQDRKNRLEIGRGWEGAVNDARAGDILRNIRPALQRGEYVAACISVIRTVRMYTTGEQVLSAAPATSTDVGVEELTWCEIFLISFFGFGFLALIGLTGVSSIAGGFFGRSSGSSYSGGGWGGGGGGSYSGGGGSYSGGGASGSW